MRIVVSAGGTGGHIYPALAIINRIKESEPKAEILYIGTTDRMEKDIIPSYGIKYIGIKVRGLERKFSFNNFKAIKYFFDAISESKRILKEFKPDLVIGVGGYVTGPVIYAAKKLGLKTMIHEQNSILGLSNRFLVKYSDVIAISFPNTIDYIDSGREKVVYTGNPCSENAIKKTMMDKTKLGLTKNKKLVLIVMGSLGSKIINNKMKMMLQFFNNKDYEILFVTGKDYYEEFNSLSLANNIKIVPYIEDMVRIMKDTDLMISRAGATTMSEIIALSIPTILIPSPHVTDNHQLKNALDLVEKNAALLIEEHDLDGDILVRTVDKILSDDKQYNKIKINLSKNSIPDSATKIYEEIKKLINRR